MDLLMGKNVAMLENNCERVLILMAARSQAEATALPLKRNGHFIHICENFDELLSEISQGVGVVLLAGEFLASDNFGRLNSCLAQEPAWSHLPLVIARAEVLEQFMEKRADPHGHIVRLESPVLVGTMLSTICSALAYRRRQYQIRDLLVQLEVSRCEASVASRSKSDFLANMSHEVRTPLGALVGFSELLADPELALKERTTYVNAIKRNAKILSTLLDNILNLSRVESGRFEVDETHFSLRDVLVEVRSVSEPEASAKGLRIFFELMSGLPQFVRGDGGKTKQILSSIIDNAIKFTSHGDVYVRIWTELLKESSRLLLRIEVEDTGVGISALQSERLFRPFAQADSSLSRRYGGIGIGLALARKTARKLGGDVCLKWSIPGAGSCFAIHLPLERLTDCYSQETTATHNGFMPTVGDSHKKPLDLGLETRRPAPL